MPLEVDPLPAWPSAYPVPPLQPQPQFPQQTPMLGNLFDFSEPAATMPQPLDTESWYPDPTFESNPSPMDFGGEEEVMQQGFSGVVDGNQTADFESMLALFEDNGVEQDGLGDLSWVQLFNAS